jgi:hypothetical protein
MSHVMDRKDSGLPGVVPRVSEPCQLADPLLTLPTIGLGR